MGLYKAINVTFPSAEAEKIQVIAGREGVPIATLIRALLYWYCSGVGPRVVRKTTVVNSEGFELQSRAYWMIEREKV